MSALLSPPAPPDTEFDILTALTQDERSRLRELTRPSASPDTLLPVHADTGQLLDGLALCCRAAGLLQRAQRRLIPVIGRFLLVLKENPEVIEALGFEHFTSFIEEFVYIKCGFSRSSAFEAMRLVGLMPSLSIGAWEELGIEKVRTLSKVTREGEPSFSKYLKKAFDCASADDFNRYCVEQQLLDSGVFRKKPLTIIADKNIRDHFRSFVGSPEVQAVVGVSDPAYILSAMLQECSAAWMAGDGAAQPYRVVTVEVERGALPGVAAQVAWNCVSCSAGGSIHLGGSGDTFNNIRQAIEWEHRHSSPACDVTAGGLILRGVA